MASELYFTAEELEQLTGTPKSTFRYWASVNQGPPSSRLGRRRVWRRDAVMKWLADQERATTTNTTA
jgi:prophage regulatory protein